MSDDRVLAVRDLVVERGGSRVLDGASFDVHRGDRLGVVTEDAASRSALVGALLGSPRRSDRAVGDVTFYPPEGDPIDVLDLGRSAGRQFRWQHVALVPANPSEAFNPTTTIGAAFEETLRAHGADAREGMERAADLIEAFGRDGEALLEATPDRLRDDDMERAALALGLLLEPAVLVVEGSATALGLLDEAAAALPDDLAVVAMGAGPEAVASFATRLAVVYGGDVVAEGPTAEVVENPDHPYVRELLRDR